MIFRRIAESITSQNWFAVILEMFIVVFGIFIGLQVDGWWQAQQEARQRDKLVVTLQQDFAQTKNRLQASIDYGSDLLARTTDFLAAVADADMRSNMPLDQLIHLANAARQGISFVPATSSYEAALASGHLALLENRKFFEAVTDFNLGYESYVQTDRIYTDLYYRGAIWEIRRELGTLRIWEEDRFDFPDEFRLSEQEMRNVFVLPVVYAAIENARQAQVNYMRSLCQMYEATTNVIAALEDMEFMQNVSSDRNPSCEGFRINPELPTTSAH